MQILLLVVATLLTMLAAIVSFIVGDSRLTAARRHDVGVVVRSGTSWYTVTGVMLTMISLLLGLGVVMELV